jgi:hypothetical protein
MQGLEKGGMMGILRERQPEETQRLPQLQTEGPIRQQPAQQASAQQQAAQPVSQYRPPETPQAQDARQAQQMSSSLSQTGQTLMRQAETAASQLPFTPRAAEYRQQEIAESVKTAELEFPSESAAVKSLGDKASEEMGKSKEARELGDKTGALNHAETACALYNEAAEKTSALEKLGATVTELKAEKAPEEIITAVKAPVPLERITLPLAREVSEYAKSASEDLKKADLKKIAPKEKAAIAALHKRGIAALKSGKKEEAALHKELAKAYPRAGPKNRKAIEKASSESAKGRMGAADIMALMGMLRKSPSGAGIPPGKIRERIAALQARLKGLSALPGLSSQLAEIEALVGPALRYIAKAEEMRKIGDDAKAEEYEDLAVRHLDEAESIFEEIAKPAAPGEAPAKSAGPAVARPAPGPAIASPAASAPKHAPVKPSIIPEKPPEAEETGIPPDLMAMVEADFAGREKELSDLLLVAGEKSEDILNSLGAHYAEKMKKPLGTVHDSETLALITTTIASLAHPTADDLKKAHALVRLSEAYASAESRKAADAKEIKSVIKDVFHGKMKPENALEYVEIFASLPARPAVSPKAPPKPAEAKPAPEAPKAAEKAAEPEKAGPSPSPFSDAAAKIEKAVGKADPALGAALGALLSPLRGVPGPEEFELGKVALALGDIYVSEKDPARKEETRAVLNSLAGGKIKPGDAGMYISLSASLAEIEAMKKKDPSKDKTPYDLAIGKIVDLRSRMAKGEAYAEEDFAGINAYVLAARAYAASEKRSDREFALGLSKKLNAGELNPEKAEWLSSTMLERFAAELAIEKSLKGKEENAALVNLRAYFDIAIVLYERGDRNGAAAVSELARLYAKAITLGPEAGKTAEFVYSALGDFSKNAELAKKAGKHRVLALDSLADKAKLAPSVPDAPAWRALVSPSDKRTSFSEELEARGIPFGRFRIDFMEHSEHVDSLEFYDAGKFIDKHDAKKRFAAAEAHFKKESKRAKDPAEAERLAREASRADYGKMKARLEANASLYDSGKKCVMDAVALKKKALDLRLSAGTETDAKKKAGIIAEAERIDAEALELYKRGEAIKKAASAELSALATLGDSIVSVRTLHRERGWAELDAAATVYSDAGHEIASVGTLSEDGKKKLEEAAGLLSSGVRAVSVEKALSAVLASERAKIKELEKRHEADIETFLDEEGRALLLESKKKKEEAEAIRAKAKTEKNPDKRTELLAEAHLADGKAAILRRDALKHSIRIPLPPGAEKPVGYLEDGRPIFKVPLIPAYDAEGAEKRLAKAKRYLAKEELEAARRARAVASTLIAVSELKGTVALEHYRLLSGASDEEKRTGMVEFRTFDLLASLDEAARLADEGRIEDALIKSGEADAAIGKMVDLQTIENAATVSKKFAKDRAARKLRYAGIGEKDDFERRMEWMAEETERLKTGIEPDTHGKEMHDAHLAIAKAEVYGPLAKRAEEEEKAALMNAEKILAEKEKARAADEPSRKASVAKVLDGGDGIVGIRGSITAYTETAIGMDVADWAAKKAIGGFDLASRLDLLDKAGTWDLKLWPTSTEALQLAKYAAEHPEHVREAILRGEEVDLPPVSRYKVGYARAGDPERYIGADRKAGVKLDTEIEKIIMEPLRVMEEKAAEIMPFRAEAAVEAAGAEASLTAASILGIGKDSDGNWQILEFAAGEKEVVDKAFIGLEKAEAGFENFTVMKSPWSKDARRGGMEELKKGSREIGDEGKAVIRDAADRAAGYEVAPSESPDSRKKAIDLAASATMDIYVSHFLNEALENEKTWGHIVEGVEFFGLNVASLIAGPWVAAAFYTAKSYIGMAEASALEGGWEYVPESERNMMWLGLGMSAAGLVAEVASAGLALAGGRAIAGSKALTRIKYGVKGVGVGLMVGGTAVGISYAMSKEGASTSEMVFEGLMIASPFIHMAGTITLPRLTSRSPRIAAFLNSPGIRFAEGLFFGISPREAEHMSHVEMEEAHYRSLNRLDKGHRAVYDDAVKAAGRELEPNEGLEAIRLVLEGSGADAIAAHLGERKVPELPGGYRETIIAGAEEKRRALGEGRKPSGAVEAEARPEWLAPTPVVPPKSPEMPTGPPVSGPPPPASGAPPPPRAMTPEEVVSAVKAKREYAVKEGALPEKTHGPSLGSPEEMAEFARKVFLGKDEEAGAAYDALPPELRKPIESLLKDDKFRISASKDDSFAKYVKTYGKRDLRKLYDSISPFVPRRAGAPPPPSAPGEAVITRKITLEEGRIIADGEKTPALVAVRPELGGTTVADESLLGAYEADIERLRVFSPALERVKAVREAIESATGEVGNVETGFGFSGSTAQMSVMSFFSDLDMQNFVVARAASPEDAAAVLARYITALNGKISAMDGVSPGSLKLKGRGGEKPHLDLNALSEGEIAAALLAGRDDFIKMDYIVDIPGVGPTEQTIVLKLGFTDAEGKIRTISGEPGVLRTSANSFQAIMSQGASYKLYDALVRDLEGYSPFSEANREAMARDILVKDIAHYSEPGKDYNPVKVLKRALTLSLIEGNKAVVDRAAFVLDMGVNTAYTLVGRLDALIELKKVDGPYAKSAARALAGEGDLLKEVKVFSDTTAMAPLKRPGLLEEASRALDSGDMKLARDKLKMWVDENAKAAMDEVKSELDKSSPLYKKFKGLYEAKH